MRMCSRTFIKLQRLIHRKLGLWYKLRITNGRWVFSCSRLKGEFMNADAKFPMKELSFIKGVKQYVEDNEIYKKVKNRFKSFEDEKLKDAEKKKKIKYFFYNKKIVPGTVFKDYIEIDMKSAFWVTAYRLGIINKEIFDKGMYGYIDKNGEKVYISKKSRLAAIGTLAKRYRDFEFDGVNLTKHPPVESKLTEFLWDEVCYQTGKVMYKAGKIAEKSGKINGTDTGFAFGWVDALFVHVSVVAEVKAFFKEAGYGTSTYKCEEIIFSDRKIVVDSKAKGKWVRRKNKETGKKERVWETKRPFPYKQLLKEEDILKLAAEK